jgi:hypothetical protein
MWIFLSDTFVSIVQPGADIPKKERDGKLLVRARVRGDLQKLFPHAKVSETPTRDYLFRCLVPRERVAAVIANEITNINYMNFKNSVIDNRRHTAYGRVWSMMLSLQEPRPGWTMKRSVDF